MLWHDVGVTVSMCREPSIGGSQHGAQRLTDAKRWVAQMRCALLPHDDSTGLRRFQQLLQDLLMFTASLEACAAQGG